MDTNNNIFTHFINWDYLLIIMVCVSIIPIFIGLIRIYYLLLEKHFKIKLNRINKTKKEKSVSYLYNLEEFLKDIETSGFNKLNSDFVEKSSEMLNYRNTAIKNMYEEQLKSTSFESKFAAINALKEIQSYDISQDIQSSQNKLKT